MFSWKAVSAAYKAQVARRPTLLYGVPFVGIIVFGSFGLAQFTQIRYIQHDQRTRAMTQEEQLRLKQDRKRLDLREEYFKLMAKDDGADDWEPKRVPRPANMPEWGGVPEPAPAGKEAVEADLSKNSPSSFFARRTVHAEELSESQQDINAAPVTTGRKSPVVLGPDGKPCRACSARVAFGAAMRAQPKQTPTKKTQDACPADVEELGRSTWTFLHSAAAYFPEKPSKDQKASMQAVLDALPLIYPCSSCAEELRNEYKRQAPDSRQNAVQNGSALQKYLCLLHNEVNARLGKPLWNCDDAQRLRHRWYEPAEDSDCL
ncbi:thiol oxidase [Malassezia yamatoensis]|uniref:Sulfhydryl oxidase n=1 Tax=Malassezia yamatoensis TaxID=253288 RepID=A0AAJ5YT47_9BASI|nr:thiol oxidase [Malassezia yamatoensis]